MLPIGFYSYPGAIQSLSFNAGTYYQWPIYVSLLNKLSNQNGNHRLLVATNAFRNEPYK